VPGGARATGSPLGSFTLYHAVKIVRSSLFVCFLVFLCVSFFFFCFFFFLFFFFFYFFFLFFLFFFFFLSTRDFGGESRGAPGPPFGPTAYNEHVPAARVRRRRPCQVDRSAASAFRAGAALYAAVTADRTGAERGNPPRAMRTTSRSTDSAAVEVSSRCRRPRRGCSSNHVGEKTTTKREMPRDRAAGARARPTCRGLARRRARA